MNTSISLTIFFPVFNEEANIAETIARTMQVVEASPYIHEYELIIIDDGSTDSTRKIAESLSARFPQVRTITHAENRGYGAALKTGIAAARMDYIFFTDADLQFDIVELQNLIVHLPSYPVIIGYRAPRRDPFMRMLNARGWNLLNRVLFGLRIRDIDCAFKLFGREIVQDLPLRSEGAMVSAEILIRLSRAQVPIKEVPVSHLPRQAGSPTGAKLSVIVRALREMLALYAQDLGLKAQKQALKFMGVGVLNTALDVVAYIALTRGTETFANHLVAAKFFSFLVGTLSSLLLNRSWTFGIRTRLSAAEVGRFYAMTSVSIVVNIAAMDFLISLGLYDLLALAITTVFTFAANFTLSKFWVFRERDLSPEAPEAIPARAMKNI